LTGDIVGYYRRGMFEAGVIADAGQSPRRSRSHRASTRNIAPRIDTIGETIDKES
jgi:hypothetical protein